MSAPALNLFGAPGVRDPDNVCAEFAPGKPSLGGDCGSDGHYLCNECKHRKTCAGCGHSPMHCECKACFYCKGWPAGSVSKAYGDHTCECTRTRCHECRQLHRYCECVHDIEVPYSI